MASSSFAAQKSELDEACLFLRSFTLGQQGFTQRDGIAGIKRVDSQCDRLAKLFASGPCAKQAAALVLRHYHGYSNREIAAALGVPDQTVASRLAAARKELQAVLGRKE